ncbi:MAG: hypothetical protein CM1200mP16_08680 [Nitrospina sp.]|nr:MAG: hypothetical protein CM1200mP16_08680 [Nitrospina sp.]
MNVFIMKFMKGPWKAGKEKHLIVCPLCEIFPWETVLPGTRKYRTRKATPEKLLSW